MNMARPDTAGRWQRGPIATRGQHHHFLTLTKGTVAPPRGFCREGQRTIEATIETAPRDRTAPGLGHKASA